MLVLVLLRERVPDNEPVDDDEEEEEEEDEEDDANKDDGDGEGLRRATGRSTDWRNVSKCVVLLRGVGLGL